MDKLEEIFFSFLKENITNTFLQKKYIDYSRNDLNNIFNTINSKDSKSFADELGLLPNLINFNQVNDIYTDISLRSFIIMKLSTFEHYLKEITLKITSKKDEKVFNNLALLNSNLNIDIKTIIWDDLYFGFSELVQRRNLYVHNNWIINKEYIDKCKKWWANKDVYFKVNQRDIWKKLEIESYMYILFKNISLITLLFLITTIKLNKIYNKKEFDRYLSNYWYSLLNHDEYQYIITSSYRIISWYINIKQNILFCLIYINALSLSIDLYKKQKQEYEIWKSIYNAKINLIIDNPSFTDEQLLYFYSLNNDSINFTKIISEDIIKNKSDKLIIYIFENDIMWKMFIKNSSEILSCINQSWLKISSKRLQDFLLKDVNYNINLDNYIWKQ